MSASTSRRWQHTLINVIISDVNLTDAKVKPVPAKVSMPLHAFKDAPPFNLNFNYWSVIGKLNDLTQTSRGNKCTLPPRLPSILLTQGSLIGKPFPIWFDTWRKSETLAFASSLNWTGDLSVTVTQTSQAFVISHLLTLTPVYPSLGVDGWHSMQDVPSSGLPNFNFRQPYIRSANQYDNYGASNIVLPCPGS